MKKLLMISITAMFTQIAVAQELPTELQTPEVVSINRMPMRASAFAFESRTLAQSRIEANKVRPSKNDFALFFALILVVSLMQLFFLKHLFHLFEISDWLTLQIFASQHFAFLKLHFVFHKTTMYSKIV